MQDIKPNFEGGLNLDDSYIMLPPNSYVDALNVTRDTITGSNDKVIANIEGNQLVPYTFKSGTNICIGCYNFELRNQTINFIFNSNGYHSITLFDATKRTITKIFESITDSGGIDVLNFTQYDKINSVNIYPRDEGDLLFFVDSLGRPTGLDISRFISGEYTPVTRDILDKCKKPPLSPPQVVYGNDTTVRANDLKNKLFRFNYRWIYDDFEKSVFSPISAVPLPINILDDTFNGVITNNNVIYLTATTGDKNVKSVEIGMSYVNGTNNWSDFESVVVLDKNILILTQQSDNTIGTGTNSVSVSFSGAISVGAVVNVYLTQLPSTVVLIGTYTVVLGDTLSSIANNLSTSISAMGIALSSTPYANSLSFNYNNVSYNFDKTEIVNANGNVDNIDIHYSFYNSSNYPVIDVNEAIQLYDYVPDLAKSQSMPNGNVLTYAGITEGFDKDTIENAVITINTQPATNGGVIGNLSVVIGNIIFFSGIAFCPATFSGIPAIGTVINLKIRRRSDGVIITGGTYTTIAGDTPNSIVNKFTVTATNAYVNGRAGNILTVALDTGTYESFASSNDWISYEIIPPTQTSADSSIPTWKWSSQRNIARAYFDQHGKTNGILYTDKIQFPAYAENGSFVPLLPYINYKIYDIPPIWAYSMQFYFTKDGTQYKFWQSQSVLIDTSGTDKYIYFEVTSFNTNATNKPTTAIVCSYVFTQGDRLRLIRDVTTNIVYNDTYDAPIVGLVQDPTINGTPQTGKNFIKIKSVAPFDGVVVITDNYVIELYTPSQQSANAENQTYYECGRQYPILNPTLPTRVHSGQVTNQVIGLTPAEYNIYDGDSYFRSRTIVVDNAGTIGFETLNIMDLNFVDFYVSEVNSINGRASIIDINAKKQYFGATLRFGQAYQANTNINGLGRFYPDNFMDVDYNYGDILRMTVRDRYLKIFQTLKIGVIPLFGQITKDATGADGLIVSDKLLNPVQYRVGNLGLSAPESLASWKYADYGCDTNKGIIWRDSNDGVVPISELYKVDSWATLELPLRRGDIKIYGVINPKKNQYIISLENTCIPIQVPSFVLPDANVGVYYLFTVPITGTNPITLSNIVAPSWLTISVSNNVLQYSGTPSTGDVGTGINTSFNISNSCTTLPISAPITIIGCIPVSVVGSPVFPNAYVGTPYSYSFDVSGTAPFTLSGITPSWLSGSVTGTTVTLSGNPPSAATGVPVSVQVNNCSGSSVVVSNTINIINSGGALTAFLSRTGNTLKVVISGGTAPYNYTFICTPTGACSSYTINTPTGSTSGTETTTTYSVVMYSGTTYVFQCNVTDSASNSVTSNSVTNPPCLVPETMITLRGGAKIKLGYLKVGVDLFGKNNKIISWEEREVDCLYTINEGLLKCSEGHVHIVNGGDLKQTIDLCIGDIYEDEKGREVEIYSIVKEEGKFKVINIATTNMTYYANGILTHNKLECP